MKKHVTAYLSFSKKELNGIIILFIAIILILGFPFCYRYFDTPETYNTSQFRKEIALFKASAVANNRRYTSFKEKIEESNLKPEYFDFDPNTASSLEWHKLGLSPRQIKIISKYVSKGGKFYRSEDLKKIYSITQEQFDGLEPYIKIKSADRRSIGERKPTAVSVSRVKPESIVLELNAADSVMLDKLRGIGPAFASRIIRYRHRLGGFYSKDQLREVYGMDSVRYSLIENQIRIDAASIRRLNINTVTFDELKVHPYLSFKQINALIQYRKQHGGYTSSADLKKVLILNEEIIRKIEPYLSFDP